MYTDSITAARGLSVDLRAAPRRRRSPCADELVELRDERLRRDDDARRDRPGGCASSRTSRPGPPRDQRPGGDVPRVQTALVVGVDSDRTHTSRDRARRHRRGGCPARAGSTRATTSRLACAHARRRSRTRSRPSRSTGPHVRRLRSRSPFSVGGPDPRRREALLADRVEHDAGDASRRVLAGDADGEHRDPEQVVDRAVERIDDPAQPSAGRRPARSRRPPRRGSRRPAGARRARRGSPSRRRRRRRTRGRSGCVFERTPAGALAEPRPQLGRGGLRRPRARSRAARARRSRSCPRFYRMIRRPIARCCAPQRRGLAIIRARCGRPRQSRGSRRSSSAARAPTPSDARRGGCESRARRPTARRAASSRSGAGRTGRSRTPGMSLLGLAGSLRGGQLATARRRADPARAAVGARRRAARRLARPPSDARSAPARTSSLPAPHQAADGRQPVRLILTANYDAGRTGVAYCDPPRRAAARARAMHPRTDARAGSAGWRSRSSGSRRSRSLRVGGSTGTAIGIAQFPPTVAPRARARAAARRRQRRLRARRQRQRQRRRGRARARPRPRTPRRRGALARRARAPGAGDGIGDRPAPLPAQHAQRRSPRATRSCSESPPAAPGRRAGGSSDGPLAPAALLRRAPRALRDAGRARTRASRRARTAAAAPRPALPARLARLPGDHDRLPRRTRTRPPLASAPATPRDASTSGARPRRRVRTAARRRDRRDLARAAPAGPARRQRPGPPRPRPA